MLKKDFIREVQAVAGESMVITQDAIKIVLDAIQTVIINELRTAGKSEIHGIATFKKVARAARNGRNPHTGEAMLVPAKEVIKVTANHVQSAVLG